MKPTNWRIFYGYRPSRSLNWSHYRLKGTIEHDYREWLRATYNLTQHEAEERIAKQKPCGLISAHHFAGEPLFVVKPPPAAPALPRILSAIRILPWTAIDRIQAAIDERLAA